MTDWRCPICDEADCSEDTMCIYSGGGTKVIFTGEGGYEIERAEARARLTVGHVYVVDKEGTQVESWSSAVKLRGIDGWFNTVMFSRGQ